MPRSVQRQAVSLPKQRGPLPDIVEFPLVRLPLVKLPLNHSFLAQRAPVRVNPRENNLHTAPYLTAKPASPVYQGLVRHSQWRNTRKRRHITVPAQTVIQVTLSKMLNSKQSKVGDAIWVTVNEPVYVGPHLAISEGSVIEGKVIDINAQSQPKGPNPYMVVQFSKLKRAGEYASTPINAELIAYKTGLKKSDYLWKLPQRPNRTRLYLGAAAEGALTGFLANPVIGTPIGAAVWVLAAMTRDRIAHRGDITLKAGQTLPISVQWPFAIAAIEPQPTSVSQAMAWQNR